MLRVYIYVSGKYKFISMAQINSFVTGHHVYKAIWTPVIGEQLICLRERGNQYDAKAVGVYKNDVLVGRVPRELSTQFHDAIAQGQDVTCQITGKRENQRRRGLEVPCVYSIRV